MPFWYMSFANAVGFLGATVVAADDEMAAVKKAHRLKINPGGEVMMWQVPEDLETHPDIVGLLNRLADREEMMKIGHRVEFKQK